MGATQELAGLTRIVSVAVNRKGERFQPRRRLSFVEQQLVEAEQNGAAVDSPGERHSDRRFKIVRGQPAAQHLVERLDVKASDQIQIQW